MITDDERSEMAAKIRNEANRRKADLGYDPDYSPFTALAVMSIGFHSFPRYEDLLHLADLIEPEERTCKVTYEYSGKQFPHCIHVKELSCGHEFRYYEPSYVPNYCSECGAKVVEE